MNEWRVKKKEGRGERELTRCWSLVLGSWVEMFRFVSLIDCIIGRVNLHFVARCGKVYTTIENQIAFSSHQTSFIEPGGYSYLWYNENISYIVVRQK